MKVCNTCKEEKSVEDFGKKAKNRDGLLSRCKTCEYAARQNWAIPGYNYDYERRSGLMKRYKMTLEQYEEMFVAQEGLCAICKCPESRTTAKGAVLMLCVDHDHRCCPGRDSCGKCVRQLLCSGCNKGLGHAKDSPALLRAMADYLESHNVIDNTDVTF